ncbi:MDP1 [Symbiodinium pilosum]|uniref:MDP1 protein n=1 Tax=Symbiodinium pilosum TaxID=2952 RepID=A0A812KKC1_SYMPI|nr:MDP1 [Symbiodinium pilosum]
MASLPSLVVFDLDACCWYPEMYMIRRGAPFSATADPTVLKTAGGQAVRLLGNVANIWKEVHRSPAFANTRVGVASRCDEPDWGRECLRKFMVEDGVSMWDVAEGGHLVEIAFSSKREHFKRLAAKTGVAFEDMLFFDDDPSNIQDVSRLGVTCIETPDGVTAEAWEEGLKQFSKRRADDAARRA